MGFAMVCPARLAFFPVAFVFVWFLFVLFFGFGLVCVVCSPLPARIALGLPCVAGVGWVGGGCGGWVCGGCAGWVACCFCGLPGGGGGFRVGLCVCLRWAFSCSGSVPFSFVSARRVPVLSSSCAASSVLRALLSRLPGASVPSVRPPVVSSLPSSSFPGHLFPRLFCSCPVSFLAFSFCPFLFLPAFLSPSSVSPPPLALRLCVRVCVPVAVFSCVLCLCVCLVPVLLGARLVFSCCLSSVLCQVLAWCFALLARWVLGGLGWGWVLWVSVCLPLCLCLCVLSCPFLVVFSFRVFPLHSGQGTKEQLAHFLTVLRRVQT